MVRAQNQLGGVVFLDRSPWATSRDQERRKAVRQVEEVEVGGPIGGLTTCRLRFRRGFVARPTRARRQARDGSKATTPRGAADWCAVPMTPSRTEDRVPFSTRAGVTAAERPAVSRLQTSAPDPATTRGRARGHIKTECRIDRAKMVRGHPRGLRLGSAGLGTFRRLASRRSTRSCAGDLAASKPRRIAEGEI